MALKTSRKQTQLTIERKYRNFLDKKINGTKLRVAAREVALREIELIQRRSQQGIDKNGRKMVPLSDGYTKTKRSIIRNGYKVVKGRGSKRRLVSIKPTAFAATRAGQFMRLSGRMFRDMYVRNLRVKQNNGDVDVSYVLDFKTARSKKIAEYHTAKGTGKSKVKRDFWGPVRKQKEQAELRRILARGLR